jgi:pyruvate carboxylase
MPGGQFTNLKEQARSLGLESRWHEVARAYAEANQLFGDIVKVTPSSKVVGDMALMMVTQDRSAVDVLDPGRDIAFPDSVVQMMKGELGQPPGGWPRAIQAKVLKGAEPIMVRPGSLLPPADLDAERKKAAEKTGVPADDRALGSHLMYPKVFADFAVAQETYGPTEVLPTPNYFYGLPAGEEIAVELEKGKTLVIRCQAVGEADDEGQVRVFFELNGQPRIARVPDRAHGAGAKARRPKAEPGNPTHVAAPMPGVISGVSVAAGQDVRAGDVLLSIEAMKMETALHADRDGKVAEVLVKAGDQIDAKDLLLRFE